MPERRTSSPKRSKTSAAAPEQVIELYGPDHDGWYDTRVKDWIALCEDLKDGEVRGYLVLRGLVVEKFRNHVRKLTLQLLCELIPSPSGGPSSLTRVRGILDGLTKVGLVTTPEGQPIKTSSRTSALTKPLRIRINDSAPADYAGWRNAEDKLKALGTALADLVEDDDRGRVFDQGSVNAGRISDPAGEAGRISDPTGRIPDPPGRISDTAGRISNPLTGHDQAQCRLPLVLSSGSSSGLSPVSGDADVSAGTASDVGERDAAAPEEPPAEAVAEGAGQDDADVVVDAYAAALRRPLLNGSRKALRDQAVELLAAGLPVGWVADRAREMAARPEWKDLAKHCDRSKVPVQGQGGEPAAPSGRRMCRKPGHGGGAFPADDCPECVRESRPRREGASRVDTTALIAALHSRQNR